MNDSGWCCRRDLNSRPLPYQGSALPLSYGSDGARIDEGGGPRNPSCACGGRWIPVAVGPRSTTMTKGGQTARAARLKAALKANMGRRKAQARARAEDDAEAGGPDAAPAPAEGDDEA